MRSVLAGLRRLVVPWGASADQARVVISTDDPLAQQLDRDAAIVYYYGNSLGFVEAVNSLGGNRGSWTIFGSDGAGPHLTESYLVFEYGEGDESAQIARSCDVTYLGGDAIRIGTSAEFVNTTIEIGAAASLIQVNGEHFSIHTGNMIGEGPAAGGTVTGTAFADLPAGAVATSVPIKKLHSSVQTALRCRLECTARSDTAAGVLQWGVRIDVAGSPGGGANFNLARQKFDAANQRYAKMGERDIPVVAGDRVVQIIWRGRAAGPTYTWDDNDTVSLTVEEVPII